MNIAYINLEDYDGSSEKTNHIVNLVNRYDVVFLSEVLSGGADVLSDIIDRNEWHALKSAFAYTHQLFALSKSFKLMPHANAIRVDAPQWEASSSMMDRFLSVKVKGCVLVAVHFKSSKGTRTPTFVNEQRQRAMSTFRISKLIHISTSPVVVFGDFNSRHNENGVLELFRGTSGLHPVKFTNHSNDIDHVFRNEYATLNHATITPQNYSDHPLISFVIHIHPTTVRQYVKKRSSKGRSLQDLLNSRPET